MKEASRTSPALTSKDSAKCISLPGFQDGPTPCASPESPMTDLFGQALVPASPSPAQESKKVVPTIATSGRICPGSSASAALTSFLVSRLAALLPTDGSMEYQMTWKRKVTPSGRSYSQLAASGRRTSGSGCGGSHIVLNTGAKCIVDPEDFLLLNRWKCQEHEKGYAYRNTRSGKVYMHRMLADAKPGEITDHINRNRLDNRRKNLRIATHSESNHNRQKGSGVRKPKGRNRWTATLWINNRFYWLGAYKTEAEALAARKEAEATMMAGWPTPTSLSFDQSHQPGNNRSMNKTVELIQENQNAHSQTTAGNQQSPRVEDRPTGQDPQPIPPVARTCQLAGWAAPRAGETGRTRSPEAIAKARLKGGSVSLEDQVHLSGWNTPRATDGTHGGPNQSGGALPADAAKVLGGWETPHCPRAHDSDNSSSTYLDRQARSQVSGPPTTSSPAETEKRGVLAPAFSGWLQGFPPEWYLAGQRAIMALKSSKGKRK